MSVWLLQLTLLAYLRFGSTEGDPLPLALVELVRSSAVSSVEDLRLLLLSDSVEEDQDHPLEKGLQSNDTISRLPRSLGAQPAQQALCKVRTEVLEVTRAMLDRRNANFLLWPPCVEVQRCSGCCNTRSLQCVPTLTHTRYLQVMKIQYANKHPYYEKAIIPIVDHLECRCQKASPPVVPRTTLAKPTLQRKPSRDPKVKVHTKEELHRHDELKHNQRVQFADAAFPGQSWLATAGQMHTWQSGGDPGTMRTPLLGPPAVNRTWQPWQPEPPHQGAEESSTHIPENQPQQDSQFPQYRVSQLPQYDMSPSESDAGHRRQQAVNTTGETQEGPGRVEQRHGMAVTERRRSEQLPDRPPAFSEKKEEVLTGKVEEEKHPHHLHHPTEAHITAQTAAMVPPTPGRPPPPPPAVQLPPRQGPPRKRKRKSRNRISKASIRAILM